MAKQLYSTILPEIFKTWLEFHDYIAGEEGFPMKKGDIITMNIPIPPKPNEIIDGYTPFKYLRGSWECSYILASVAEELLDARLDRDVIHKFQMGLAQLPVVLPVVYEGIDKLIKVSKRV